jgi:hypothetical protein
MIVHGKGKTSTRKKEQNQTNLGHGLLLNRKEKVRMDLHSTPPHFTSVIVGG